MIPMALYMQPSACFTSQISAGDPAVGHLDLGIILGMYLDVHPIGQAGSGAPGTGSGGPVHLVPGSGASGSLRSGGIGNFLWYHEISGNWMGRNRSC